MNCFMSVNSRSLLQFVFPEAIIWLDSSVFKVDLYLSTSLTPASKVTLHSPFLLDFIDRRVYDDVAQGLAHFLYLGCVMQ